MPWKFPASASLMSVAWSTVRIETSMPTLAACSFTSWAMASVSGSGLVRYSNEILDPCFASYSAASLRAFFRLGFGSPESATEPIEPGENGPLASTGMPRLRIWLISAVLRPYATAWRARMSSNGGFDEFSIRYATSPPDFDSYSCALPAFASSRSATSPSMLEVCITSSSPPSNWFTRAVLSVTGRNVILSRWGSPACQ